MLDEMSTALEDELGLPMPEDWPDLYATLARDDDATLRELGLWLAVTFGDSSAFPALRATLSDASTGVERRERALDALVRGHDDDSLELLHGLAAQRGPLRRAALRALARFDDPSTASRLLAIYPDLDVEEARDAVNTMSARASWSRELVAAVKAGVVEQSDVGAFVLRQLDSHRDPELAALISELWLRRPSSEVAAARIAELTDALSKDVLAHAEPSNGRALFAKTCAQCHTLFDVGGGLAPELTGSNRGDLDYVLTNLVDPNAVIGKDYQVTLAWLHDGRLIAGIEKARTETALTLESQDETVVVGLDEIELLGWLELHLDCAPVLIVAGVNDGCIPATGGADAILPDRLRQRLGLLHDDSRYARDAYLLRAILASRPEVTIVAGRHDADDEPLTPRPAPAGRG